MRDFVTTVGLSTFFTRAHILQTANRPKNQLASGHQLTTCISSYPIQESRPPRRRATPITIQARELSPRPNLKSCRRAIRNSVMDCIEHTSATRVAAPNTQGWDGSAAGPPFYLRHPLNVPVFGRRALIFRMSATHSRRPSPRQPRLHLFNSPPSANLPKAVAFSAGPSGDGIFGATCWFGARRQQDTP